eukprot:Opistho-1_new@25714
MAAMSAPAAKAVSPPVTTMAPMPASASKASSAAPRASMSASSSALSWRGRFRVITPTRPSTWASTGASGIVMNSVHHDLLARNQRGQHGAFVGQQLAELGRAHGHGLGTQVAVARLDGGQRQRLAEFGAHAGQHLGRRAVGRPHAEPDVEVGAREALLAHRGHLGEEGRALGAHDAQQLGLAGADVLEGDAGVADEIGLAREHVLQRRRRAAVGHVRHLRAGGLLEQLAGQVRRRARAGRGVRERAGLGSRQRDQFAHVLRGQLRLGDEVHLRAPDRGHRREVARRQQARLEERGVGGLDRSRRDEEGVAVGRGAHHFGGRDVAAGAGLVVDQHGLAERLRQRLREDARHHVGAAAGRKADDHADGLGRPCASGCGCRRLGPGRMAGEREATQCGHGAAQPPAHAGGELLLLHNLSPLLCRKDRQVRSGGRGARFVRAQQVAQLEFLDLSGGRGRHRLAHHEALRDVLQRHLLGLEEGNDRRQVELPPRLGHHHRAGALAQALVGVGDHGGHGHVGVAVQQRLDLDHGNVLAAANDHVLGAPGDAHVAALVDAREVAGVEPVGRVGAVELRALQVAAEVGAGAQQQLADLARRQRQAVDIDHLELDAGQRAAVGVDGALVVVVQPRERDGAVLGHAPGRHDLGAQRLARLLDQRARNGRAGAQKGAQRGHGRARLGHGLRQVGEEGCGRHGEAHALGVDRRDGLLRLPDVLQHHRGLQHDGHHEPVHEAGLVRHGRGHEHHVAGAQAQALRVGHDVGHGGVGRVHHALGLAGGARGVDELGHVVGAGPVLLQDLRGIGLLLPCGAGQQRLEAVGAAAADHHHLCQVGQAGLQARGHLFEVEAPEARRHDQHLGRTVPQHERQLALAEDVHQRVHHRAEARAGQVGQRELPPVGQLTGHHVVAPHAQPRQADGDAVGHAAQLAVGEAHGGGLALAVLHAHRGERHLVGTGGNAGVERIVDGAVVPQALGHHARAARGQQYGVEFHDVLSPLLVRTGKPGNRRLRRHRRAPGARAGDDGLHDLGRAVADLEAQHVAQALLHRPAVVAAVAEHQQALVDGVVGQLGAPPLAHGGLGGVRRALVLEPQGLQAQQARSLDLRVEVGQRMRHALERRQRLAEGLALRDVLPGFFQRHARHGQHLQPDERAREVEALHDLHEALVLLAQPVVDRHAHVLEEQRAAPDGALAVAVEAVARDTGQVHRHQQRGHAVGGRFDAAGAPEHHGRVGLVGGRDGGLLAVEHVVIAHALHAQAQVGGVGAAARLGQRNGEQRLALRELGQPRRHHLGPAVLAQDLPVERGQQVDVAQAQVGAGDLFVDHAGRQAAQALAAVGLGQLGRDEAHLAHLAHQRAVEHARGVALQEAGRHAPGGEAARMLGQRRQVVVDVRVHRGGPAAATWRTCGTRACAVPAGPRRPRATLRCRSTA